MSRQWKTPEEKQELYRRMKEEIKIGDYAYEIGLTPIIRPGNRYMSLKEHDSVKIDVAKNCFWRNSVPGQGQSIGKGGSVIDFALEFSDKSLSEILADFEDRVNNHSYEKNVDNKKIHDVVQKTEGLNLPPASPHMKNVFAYLTKSRFIEKDIVQEFVDNKMLYQDTRNNCVFVAYDYTDPEKQDQPVFGAIRGTNTEKRFLRDVEGSDYQKGFYVNNYSDCVVITESVIEAMSVMSVLHQKGIDYHNYNYLALSGTGKGEPLKTITEHCPKFEKYVFALNNDEGGIRATTLYANYLKNDLKVESDLKIWKPKTPGYDWNDELKKGFFDRFGTRLKKKEKKLDRVQNQDYELVYENEELER